MMLHPFFLSSLLFETPKHLEGAKHQQDDYGVRGKEREQEFRFEGPPGGQEPGENF